MATFDNSMRDSIAAAIEKLESDHEFMIDKATVRSYEKQIKKLFHSEHREEANLKIGLLRKQIAKLQAEVEEIERSMAAARPESISADDENEIRVLQQKLEKLRTPQFVRKEKEWKRLRRRLDSMEKGNDQRGDKWRQIEKLEEELKYMRKMKNYVA